ncbi:TIGR01458 family HAD-type hydrolase [Methanotrichaceae archaeon M04Ac]|uniref:Haloacid dehalogenase-like hydrolase domain-containing protein 2 n=1 Tax=Candidatus Methanocrinis alkalitolerans TaxID=3033395 RepID=A0ABT5XDK5_9EURY|nr:TIGR01458 family HAD-type hydrolase [Candidatus Methanocrinis alkalitolerans]MDF0592723.1 TIGR01458 family HAD-type hydrolase [Candidatus Methanocrinis alkalitolerans]
MDSKAFLIDLDGVLYVDRTPIEGARETVAMLEEMGYRYRFVSNTTSKCRKSLAKFLDEMGFSIPEERIFTPAIAAVERIRSERDNRCFLLTRPDVRKDFEEAGVPVAEDEADFVVVGGAETDFTFDRLNRAFRLVMDGAEIVALEKDRYWMGADGLCLSAGPFVAALEYATGTVAEVVGKPSPDFFEMALADLRALPEETAMIGDDINTDVGGAQNAEMKGILVKTGKYREDLVEYSNVIPDLILESISELSEHL